MRSRGLDERPEEISPSAHEASRFHFAVGFSENPAARTGVGLLGPCFKTGRADTGITPYTFRRAGTADATPTRERVNADANGHRRPRSTTAPAAALVRLRTHTPRADDAWKERRRDGPVPVTAETRRGWTRVRPLPECPRARRESPDRDADD